MFAAKLSLRSDLLSSLIKYKTLDLSTNNSLHDRSIIQKVRAHSWLADSHLSTLIARCQLWIQFQRYWFQSSFGTKLEQFAGRCSIELKLQIFAWEFCCCFKIQLLEQIQAFCRMMTQLLLRHEGLDLKQRVLLQKLLIPEKCFKFQILIKIQECCMNSPQN